jgi:hypothetical protein
MSQTVEGMESERKSQKGLSSVFDAFRECGDKFYDTCAAESVWCDEVGEGVTIKDWENIGSKARSNYEMRLTDAESCTSSTVEDRSDPCKLGLVDGEVRAGRALETLLVEDLLRGRGRERLGLDSTRANDFSICISIGIFQGIHRFPSAERRTSWFRAAVKSP